LEASLKSFYQEPSYKRTGTFLVLAYCVVCPFSIALSQIVIGLLLAYSIYCLSTANNREKFFDSRLSSQILNPISFLVAPIICWVAVSGSSGFFGLEVIRSFLEFLNATLFLSFPFLIYLTLVQYSQVERLKTITKLLIALAISQAIASLHSIIEASFNTELIIGIPGPLTESGQMVLVIPCLLAVIFVKHSSENSNILASRLNYLALFVSLLIFAWPQSIGFVNTTVIQVISAAIALALITCLIRCPKSFPPLKLLAIICVGLIVNLKRGPWLGVFSTILILGSFLSKKLLLSVSLVFLAAFVFLTPVRERALSVTDHYLIGGGRHEMWTLGLEIMERFPLGVGLDNVDVIQELDPDLPETHRHMHNNFLNIAVELGWLGLLVYLWWMFSFIKVGIANALAKKELSEKDIYLLAFSTALLGWQIAGIAEYNFGDSEIKLLAFMIMGFIMSLSQVELSQTTKNRALS